MDPQPTAVERPIHVRIADDIRMQIERGELQPGDSLPTLHVLAEQWSCSLQSARTAIALLKRQALITGGRGKAPVVRTPRRQVTRSSERHQAEKDMVLKPEDERRKVGVAETDMGVSLDQLSFDARYDTVSADEDLARAFSVAPGTELLRRTYETSEPASDHRHFWSVSYIPRDLVSSNPDLLTAEQEPWPGGTQHQLSTVGIEVARIVDEVTATTPTTVDIQKWDLDEGVPLLRVRRISIDVEERVVEVSDADFPADRTKLQFTTPLERWESRADD